MILDWMPKKVREIEKYQKVTREMKRIWTALVRVVPVINDAFDTTPKLLPKRLSTYEKEQ